MPIPIIGGLLTGLKGLLIGGGALAVGDQVITGGQGTDKATTWLGQAAEGILGKWNRYVNTGMNNISALDRNLEEQSQSMGWFNTINGWLFSLCNFLNLDKAAQFFKKRMVDTTQEILDHTDNQREMLDEQGRLRDDRFDTTPDSTLDEATGEVTLQSSFSEAINERHYLPAAEEVTFANFAHMAAHNMQTLGSSIWGTIRGLASDDVTIPEAIQQANNYTESNWVSRPQDVSLLGQAFQNIGTLGLNTYTESLERRATTPAQTSNLSTLTPTGP